MSFVKIFLCVLGVMGFIGIGAVLIATAQHSNWPWDWVKFAFGMILIALLLALEIYGLTHWCMP